MRSETQTILFFIFLTTISSMVDSSKLLNKSNSLTMVQIKSSNLKSNESKSSTADVNSPILLEVKSKESSHETNNSKSKETTNVGDQSLAQVNVKSLSKENNSQVDFNSSRIAYRPGSTMTGFDSYKFAHTTKCTPQNCQLPYGICSDANTCVCTTGYSNFILESIPSPLYCTYIQKKQLTAFILELFFAFGVGHFYAGRTGYGTFKMIVILLPIVLLCLICCEVISKDASECCGLFTMICACLWCFAGSIWQVIDVIMFAMNSHKDGNGVPLQPW